MSVRGTAAQPRLGSLEGHGWQFNPDTPLLVPGPVHTPGPAASHLPCGALSRDTFALFSFTLIAFPSGFSATERFLSDRRQVGLFEAAAL